MPGGILFGDGEDWNRLRDSVRRVVDRFKDHLIGPICFVEVGVMGGETSRDLIKEIGERFEEHGISSSLHDGFRYYGVDAFCDCPKVYDNHFIFLKNMSYLATSNISKNIHWCLIDGCHCAQCVSRDIACYAPLLVPGGELCFHDASPLEQFRGDGNPAGPYAGDHHDVAEAAKGTAVRSVLDSVMVNRPDFRLALAAQQEQTMGGVEIYEKVKAS